MGRLFEPRDKTTSDQVIETAKMILPNINNDHLKNFHIGINDMASEGNFQYATGGDIVYTDWNNAGKV